MDKPYKVIWKYKNDNRYTQYAVYIFVGSLRSNLDPIFKKIENLNLFDTLMQLSMAEIKKLEEAYGTDWYKSFFNMYHTAFMTSQIDSNPSMLKDVSEKFGEEWYNTHIRSHKWADRKLLYSYSSLIKDDMTRKTVKKGRAAAMLDDEADLDYKLKKNTDVKSILVSKTARPQDTHIQAEQTAGAKSNAKTKTRQSSRVKVDIDNQMKRMLEKADDGESNQKSDTPDTDTPDTPKTPNVNTSDFISEHSPDTAYDMIDSQDSQDSHSQDSQISPKNQTAGRTIENRGFYNWKTKEFYALSNYTLYGYDEQDMADFIQTGGKPKADPDADSDDIDEDTVASLYESVEVDADNVEEMEEGEGLEDVDTDTDADTLEKPVEKQKPAVNIDADDDFEMMKDEEMDMEEIQQMYYQEDVEADSNISHTSDLIKKALDDDNLFKKSSKMMMEFDQEKNAAIHAEKLRDVFQKKFVRTQFIFGDDTIKVVKNKVCCSLKNNKKFSNTRYVLPSRQYMWSEYVFGNSIEKVMIGQKWIRRNELLDVDIEPDNRLYMYEQLKDQLGMLRHNLRRHANKIRKDDDEYNILHDYEGYLTDHEIYMIDIYNELGKSYNPDNEILKNLQDVYLKIYFPSIRADDLKTIISYLNGETKAEDSKLLLTYETINNDMIIENEITHVVEHTKKEHDISKMTAIFKEKNYVTNSTLHVNLRFGGTKKKIDLYRIFNEFQTDSKYPYIQYQTVERGAVYKYSEDEINKYRQDESNMDILYKWFEISPYGINFKVRLDDDITDKSLKSKFMSIGLTELGRIEYKTIWQEAENATIDDIKKTYKYVRDIVTKINMENPSLKLVVPEDEEFKYAFINTIQKYEIPDKFVVNHNDLSEFCRFFYPYIALVTEPRKRQSKTRGGDEKSKFGTYLRYKRVHKYENQNRIEQRIIFFFRNYEFHDSKLAAELAIQFYITEESALEAIQKTRLKYPNLKKSRKILKKLENLPKYKSQGIGIDIQGKTKDRYKIRISGARTKDQLERIVEFMNIMIYLYIETYLYKKKDMQHIKDKLKKLTNIAKRRHKVEVVVDHEKSTNAVKQMAQLDKQRIGFKPEKGQSQWTRACQNSGDDKKRRPQQYNAQTANELTRKGFKYNEKLDVFEKRIKAKKKNEPDIVLRTIRLPDIDENGNITGKYIHYACDPEENGTHMFIGFLTRSENPFGQCMPCCFKKDPATSDNKVKRDFFNQCLGKAVQKKGEEIKTKTAGDKLYILQDTNKIQEGRFGFLPKYLDRYFNTMLSKEKSIKHHYLESTKTGYYFKYGSIQSSFQFLNAISSALDMSVDSIKDAMVSSLDADKTEQIFTSLNNGDIKTQFETRENFIEFIRTSPYLDYIITKDLICIPGVLTPNGLNLVIFRKREIKTKGVLEKERTIENYFLDCRDSESFYTITDPLYKTIFLIRDNKNYYPIVMVIKEDKNTKTVKLEKVFTYVDADAGTDAGTENSNIVHHVSDYYIKNCSSYFTISGSISGSTSLNMKSSAMASNSNINAKIVAYMLRQMGKAYYPRYQVIDIRNKCKYLITVDGVLIPVRPSGCPWDVQIIKSVDKYIKDLDITYTQLMDIYKKSKKAIPVKPIGIYYESMKGDEVKVNSIMTKTKDLVPVTPVSLKKSDLDSMKLKYEKKPLTDKIDREILKGPSNYVIDERMISVSQKKFEEEAYNLFRLEFSNYINKDTNEHHKRRIQKLMSNPKTTKNEKIDAIRLVLYKLIDPKLHSKYAELVESRDTDQAKADIEDKMNRERIDKLLARGNADDGNDSTDEDDAEQEEQAGGSLNSNPNPKPRMFNHVLANAMAQINGYEIPLFTGTVSHADRALVQVGGRINKLVHRISKNPDITNYVTKNDRQVCEIHEDREQCNANANPHCRWSNNACYFALTTDMIVAFINMISEELASNELKAYEIMRVENYFVSDVVDRNKFSTQPGQKILRASSSNVKRVLRDLFGSDNTPTIGKRRNIRMMEVNYNDLNIKYSLLDLKSLYVQRIIDNNISIFRAYSNGYYWLINSFYDKDTRNLGYYSPLQSDLANRFKAAVIDWVSDPNNASKITQEMMTHMGNRINSIDPIMEYVNRLSNEVDTMSIGVTELLILSKINHTIPIIVRSDNFDVLHIYDNSEHIENPSNTVVEKYDMGSCINIKFNFVGNRNVPDFIDAVYYKAE